MPPYRKRFWSETEWNLGIGDTCDTCMGYLSSCSVQGHFGASHRAIRTNTSDSGMLEYRSKIHVPHTHVTTTPDSTTYMGKLYFRIMFQAV